MSNTVLTCVTTAFLLPRCSLSPLHARRKIFEASRKLIPAKDAVMFPAMEVSNLASDDSAAAAEGVDFLERVLAGRVTMVGLFHRQFGYSMLPSWTEPFEDAFPQPRQGEWGLRFTCVCARVCVYA